MSRRVQKIVETEAEETRIVKTKGRREKKKKGKKYEEKKIKKKRIIEINKIVKEWKIQDKEKEAVKSKEEFKKLVPQRFHKWTYVFGKKVSKRMLTKKLWDYMVEIKKKFVPRKRKVYFLSRKERGEVYKFIKEQLRKEYIRLLKLF